MAYDDRGPRSARPVQPQQRHTSWWSFVRTVYGNIGRDNVPLLAAGLALYALLAAFPALFAAVSIYGLVMSPESIASHIQALGALLPQQAAQILEGSLRSLAEGQSGTLSVGLAIGVLLSLWSARKGMDALMTASNIAYHEDEDRGMLKRMLVSLGLTAAAVFGFVMIVLLAIVAPIAWRVLALPDEFQALLSAVQWAVLWCLIVLALDVVYRFAPSHDRSTHRWFSPGAIAAASLWAVGSVLFQQYVRSFGSYGETYGALSSVVVLLLWFYLSSYVVLLGAEINAELDRERGRAPDPRFAHDDAHGMAHAR